MSKFYTEAAEQAATKMLEAFDKPEDLPAALKQIALATGSRHCDSYSMRNQLLVWLFGHADAAGYKQWRNQYGRQVRKGEKAFPVLAPVTKSFTKFNEETQKDERVTYITGWRDVKVFGIEQTDVCDEEKAAKYEGRAAAVREHMDSLPWTDVAHAWGLSVTPNGALLQRGVAGCFVPNLGIQVAVENLATWAHELVHAADQELGTLTKKPGQQPDNEIVAELGGAVLCLIAGHSHEADLGGAWEYIKGYSKDPVKDAGKLLDRIIECVGLIMKQAETPHENILAA